MESIKNTGISEDELAKMRLENEMSESEKIKAMPVTDAEVEAEVSKINPDESSMDARG